MELRVLQTNNTGGQQRRIDRAGFADSQGGDRDTGRHLHDRQQGVDARQHCRLHRHAEHWQVGFSRTHAGQMRGATGARNNHLQATGFGFFSVLKEQVWGAMGRHHLDFIRNAELVEHLRGMAESAPI